MGDPVTMMVAAAGTKAAGSIVQGHQQNQLAQWQAGQAENDATAAGEMGAVRADTVRRMGRLQKSSARADLAGAGVNVDSGTAGTIQDTIAGNVEHDALTELLTGQSQAKSLRAQAQSLRSQGKMAQTAGYIGAGGSLLEGGAKYSTWRSGGGKG